MAHKGVIPTVWGIPVTNRLVNDRLDVLVPVDEREASEELLGCSDELAEIERQVRRQRRGKV